MKKDKIALGIGILFLLSGLVMGILDFIKTGV